MLRGGHARGATAQPVRVPRLAVVRARGLPAPLASPLRLPRAAHVPHVLSDVPRRRRAGARAPVAARRGATVSTPIPPPARALSRRHRLVERSALIASMIAGTVRPLKTASPAVKKRALRFCPECPGQLDGRAPRCSMRMPNRNATVRESFPAHLFLRAAAQLVRARRVYERRQRSAHHRV